MLRLLDRPRPLFAGLALALALPLAASAQRPDAEIPRPSRTWAIERARVTVAPGRVMERATVVVRDGLIVAVGPNVRVPFDAQRIAGDSLHVYAAFLDGLGNVGMPKPEAAAGGARGGARTPGQPAVNPDDAPRERTGLQPERQMADLVVADDASLEAHRKAGFGFAHAVPYGGYLPGQGALLLLSGDTPAEVVYRPGVSLFSQFQTARGVAPATPMGIMAAWRTVAREAARRADLRTAYETTPEGRARVTSDPVYEAVRPALGGGLPVYFYAKDVLEARRALMLRRDLGLNVVLAGVPDAADFTEGLRAAGAPRLLLTLGLPEDKKDSAQAAYVPGFRLDRAVNIAGEKANLEARVRATRESYVGTAAALYRAGIRFGVTTLGAKMADVQKNLRRMVQAGLPEDAALAALTTTTADILGVSRQLGTVEAGKIANLVVTTKPLFAEGSHMRYVFVEGERYAYEAPATPAAGARGARGGAGAAAVTAVGTWDYEVTIQGTSDTGTIVISGTPDALAGTMNSSQGSMPLQDVSLSGNALTASVAVQGQTVRLSLTITGDTFSGVGELGPMSLPIRGTRRPN